MQFQPRGRQRRPAVIGQGRSHRTAVVEHDGSFFALLLLRLPLDGPDAAEDADAAGLEGDELAIGRHPAEPHQDAVEQRHGNRDAERLRNERDEDADDRGGVDALGDQLLGVVQNRRHQQDERQDQQRQAEGQQDLADGVAIEDLEHSRLDYTV